MSIKHFEQTAWKGAVENGLNLNTTLCLAGSSKAGNYNPSGLFAPKVNHRVGVESNVQHNNDPRPSN